MADKIMLFAIPGFFILMALELLAAWIMKRRVYRLNDAINSIGLGVLSQIVGVFAKLLTIGIYAWVVQRVALFELSMQSAWVWITALILFGPAIEDSATGKDVWLAAAMRCGLYLLVAGYGWLCILLLEQWWPVGRPLAEDKLGD